mmetsp:Transcript_32616/g.74805  ORF Transcript_32616/g.74805 Transcript_32616/m.74805 type:complete len:426 (-) Transcript_32616:168-1445(-)
MVNVGLLLAFELLCVVMWWSNQGFVVSFRKLIEWMNEQFILRKVFCYLIALVACILILAEKQGNSDDGEGDEVVWLFLSFSVLLQLLFIVRAISIPSQTFGVVALAIERMFLSDVLVFLFFFMFYLITFYFAMYFVYPRSGSSHLPYAEDFNDPGRALMAMLNLVITGNKFTVEMADGMSELDDVKRVNLFLFYLYYVGCVILLLILLLRLLMAMMTNTFRRAMEQATLEWRLQLAKLVLLVELVWPVRFGDTRAGSSTPDGKHSYYFQHFAPNAEGAEVAEGSKQVNMFLDIPNRHPQRHITDENVDLIGNENHEHHLFPALKPSASRRDPTQRLAGIIAPVGSGFHSERSTTNVMGCRSEDALSFMTGRMRTTLDEPSGVRSNRASPACRRAAGTGSSSRYAPTMMVETLHSDDHGIVMLAPA